MTRYRLRTLLILRAVVPPAITAMLAAGGLVPALLVAIVVAVVTVEHSESNALP